MYLKPFHEFFSFLESLQLMASQTTGQGPQILKT